ncbi:hypothetical protein [Pannonibacter indicus]|uniref:hypothetical protein n=1 Tax=Pannonibacter indicus TaxID=466044 RepID=UPI003919E19D
MSEKQPYTCLSARRSGVLEFSDTFVDGAILAGMAAGDAVPLNHGVRTDGPAQQIGGQ